MFDSVKYAPKSKKFIVKYKAELETGEEKALNFLCGAVMRKTKGKADPQTVKKLMMDLLK